METVVGKEEAYYLRAIIILQTSSPLETLHPEIKPSKANNFKLPFKALKVKNYTEYIQSAGVHKIHSSELIKFCCHGFRSVYIFVVFNPQNTTYQKQLSFYSFLNLKNEAVCHLKQLKLNETLLVSICH